MFRDDFPWLFVLYFVGAVWASALLASSPIRLALTMAVSALLWTSTIRMITEVNGLDSLKTTVGMLYPFGLEGGPVYEMLAFLVSAMLLFAPLLMRADLPKFEPLRIARALFVCLTSLLVLLIVLSLIGFSRFFDPLDIVFVTYLFPVMASALAVVIWSFISRLTVRPRSTDV